jgi:hypothetical protein
MLEFLDYMETLNPDLPPDLSERHDDYLVEILEAETRPEGEDTSR